MSLKHNGQIKICHRRIKEANDEKVCYGQFVVVDQHEGFGPSGYAGIIYEVYDIDTGVMYYMIDSRYSYSISPIYNANGTVKIHR